MTDEVKIFPDGRLDVKNASRYTGFAPPTLAAYRSQGRGPVYIKCGGKIFYYKKDLDEWLNSGGPVGSTAQSRVAQAD